MTKPDWTYENHPPSGSAIGFRTARLLHREQSDFQTIEIYQSTDFGHLMALDGCWMVTERDHFIYHEMMTHPALLAHRQARHVAIIGGGDCGAMREVLRHPSVATAHQIEIDQRVTALASKYFPELCAANEDPRLEQIFSDGIEWLKTREAESLDVLIVDSTDPVGPAAALFEQPFFTSCARALRPGGILVQQSESPLLDLPLLRNLRRQLPAAGFDRVTHLLFPQPCYPSGWWSCTLAGKGADLDAFSQQGWQSIQGQTRYYNEDIHHSARILPEFVRRGLGEGSN